MIHKYLLLLSLSLLFLPVSILSQVRITGRLISSNDSVPVSFSSIGIAGKAIGAISNVEGYFVLPEQVTSNDTLYIAHLNYESRKIPLTSLKVEGNVIQLAPRIFTLEEITVQGESIPEILRKAILRSGEAFSLPARLETYYREFVKEDKKYTKFSDGLLDYDLVELSGKRESRVRVNQSRAVELVGKTDGEVNFNTTSPLDVSVAVNPFHFGKLKQILEHKDQYDFHLSLGLDENGKKLMEINFVPKPGNPEPLFPGSVSIDEATRYILSFRCQLEQDPSKPDKEMNFILLKGRCNQLSSVILYKLSGTDYRPWYAGLRIELRLWNRKNFDHSFLFISDLLVNKVFKANYEPIPGKNVYKKKALYSLGNNFETAYWKEQNTIQLTNEEEEIIKQLKF